MPSIVRLQPETREADYLPPVFHLTFSLEEFPAFIANPTSALRDLGQPVGNLTVVVKDHIWDGRNRQWVTDDTEAFFANNGGVLAADAGAPDGGVAVTLPEAQHWIWLCGYQDEMCVCERVLGG